MVLNCLDLRHHAISSLVPGCPAFGPAGANIGHGQAPDEVSCQTVTAMRHRVGLDEAWLCDIPYPGLNRNMLLEQRAGLGARQPFAAKFGADRFKQAVDSPPQRSNQAGQVYPPTTGGS